MLDFVGLIFSAFPFSFFVLVKLGFSIFVLAKVVLAVLVLAKLWSKFCPVEICVLSFFCETCVLKFCLGKGGACSFDVGKVAGSFFVLVKFVFKRQLSLFDAPNGHTPPPPIVRALLIFTCTGVSFAHGSNDGQKGIGMVMLILIGLRFVDQTDPAVLYLARGWPRV